MQMLRKCIEVAFIIHDTGTRPHCRTYMSYLVDYIVPVGLTVDKKLHSGPQKWAPSFSLLRR